MGEPVAHWIEPGAARTLCGRCIQPRLVHQDWRRCKTCERKRQAEGAGYFVTYFHGWSRQRFECRTSAHGGSFTVVVSPTPSLVSPPEYPKGSDDG